MTRFREKLNRSFCLVKVNEKGWMLGKKVQNKIYITEDEVTRNICTDAETDLFRHFKESVEYEGEEDLRVGQKLVLDSFEPFYVVDAGYRGEDGKVKYLIAR